MDLCLNLKASGDELAPGVGQIVMRGVEEESELLLLSLFMGTKQRILLKEERKFFDPLYWWWSMSLRSQKKAEKTRFNFHSKGTMEKELSCIKQHQYLQSCKQLYKYHLSPSTPLFSCFLTTSSPSLPIKFFIQQKQNNHTDNISSQN